MKNQQPAEQFPVRYPRQLLQLFGCDRPEQVERWSLGFSASPGHEAANFEYWQSVSAAFLPRWIAAYPGSRPAPWWWWDAPEPLRARLGGIGQTACTGAITSPRDVMVLCRHLGMAARGPCPDYLGCWRGLPRRWTGVDERFPPLYEAEANYLKRHGLLSPAEAKRLHAADFEPERIEIAAE